MPRGIKNDDLPCGWYIEKAGSSRVHAFLFSQTSLCGRGHWKSEFDAGECQIFAVNVENPNNCKVCQERAWTLLRS